jgi:putative redox protein
MTSTTHVARAVAETNADAPPWQVELRAGTHHLVADETPVAGGADTGPSPFALLLSGLAACTAITLRMYAERHGWPLRTIEVEARYDVTDDDARIVRTVTVPPDLPVDQRRRLEEIAERTPVTNAVPAGTPIATTFYPAEAQ